MKNFLIRIKIEEFFLLFTFFISLASFLYLQPKISFSHFFISYFRAISSILKWWDETFLFLLFFTPLVYLHLFLTKRLLKIKVDFSIDKRALRIKNFLYLLRTIILIFLPFASITALNGLFIILTKDRLINSEILRWDELVLGMSPFFSLNSRTFPLKFLFDLLSPIFIFSFLLLAPLMSFSLLVFYCEENSYLFKASIISIFFVLLLGAIFWYFFPANSPLNAFWENLKENPDFAPSDSVKEKIKIIYEDQKSNPPVSTFPSMHWAWGFILVYFLLKKNRKTLFFTIPWFLFSGIGSFLLGAHYFVDAILGILLAIFSIFISNLLVKFESQYYLEDAEEKQFKKALGDVLFSPYLKEVEIFKKLLNIKNIKGP